MTEDLKNLLSITKLFQHAKLYLALAGKSGSFVMGANFFLKKYSTDSESMIKHEQFWDFFLY